MKTRYILHKYWNVQLISIILISAACSKNDNFVDELKNFNLISPSNADTNVLANPTLHWSYLNYTSVGFHFSNSSYLIYPKYKITIWDTLTQDTVVNEFTYYNDYSASLNYSSAYKWKVKAIIDDKIYKESETWKFSTEPHVYNSDITFKSQSEIDSFENKGYDIIKGRMNFEYSIDNPITEISAFNNIKSIEGGISIYGIYSLKNIEGFENLRYVGEILIWFNENLESIKGFQKLLSSGSISICCNAALNDVIGFEDLAIIDNSIEFSNNEKLELIPSFNNLYRLNSIDINNNNNLKNLNGFKNLTYLDGQLNIYNNKNLISIPDFNSVIYIRSISSFDGNKFDSIGGFENLLRTDNQLTLPYSFSSIPKFNKLKYIGGSLVIKGNQNKIEGFKNLDSIKYHLVIYSNSFNEITGFESLSYVGNGIEISYNNNLEIINAFNKLKWIGEDLNITSNNKLTSVTGFNLLTNIGRDLIVGWNFNLVDFCGFQNVIISNGIKGDFNVDNNKINPSKEDIKLINCD